MTKNRGNHRVAKVLDIPDPFADIRDKPLEELTPEQRLRSMARHYVTPLLSVIDVLRLQLASKTPDPGWSFVRTPFDKKIIATEPSGKRHIIDTGDLGSVKACELFDAMARALSGGGVS